MDGQMDKKQKERERLATTYLSTPPILSIYLLTSRLGLAPVDKTRKSKGISSPDASITF